MGLTDREMCLSTSSSVVDGVGGDVTRQIKVVIVGDQRVGKTALIQRFIANQPPNIYIPTGFDNYTAGFEVAGYSFHTTIWDTSGCPNYDTVRPLAYQDTDVFIVCFHLGDYYSLHNVITKWHPEIRKYARSGTPIILCGCQNDQRFVENLYASFELGSGGGNGGSDTKRKTVYSDEALDVCRQIGAITYVETCAYNPMTVRELFEVTVLAASGKLNRQSLLAAKHLSSLVSSSLTLSSTSPSSLGLSSVCESSTTSNCSSGKLKSSASSNHLLTRHKSLFKLRKCKSKGEMKQSSSSSSMDSKKSCAIM